MSDNLQVDPEGLRSSGEGYNQISNDLDALHQNIVNTFDAYRGAWGDDQNGQQFGQTFTQGYESLLQGLRGLRDAIHGTYQGLNVMGKMYRDIEDGAVEGAKQLREHLENGGGGGGGNRGRLEEQPPATGSAMTVRVQAPGAYRDPGERGSEQREHLAMGRGVTVRGRTLGTKQDLGERGSEQWEHLAMGRGVTVRGRTLGTKQDPGERGSEEGLPPGVSESLPDTPMQTSKGPTATPPPGQPQRRDVGLAGPPSVAQELPGFETSQLGLRVPPGKVLVDGRPIPAGYEVLTASVLPDGTVRLLTDQYAGITPMAGHSVTTESPDGGTPQPYPQDQGERLFLVKNKPEGEAEVLADRPQENRPHYAFLANGKSFPYRPVEPHTSS